MKKKVKNGIITIFLLIVIGGVGFTLYKIINDPDFDPGNLLNQFDNEDRYDDSVLDYMGVIYENQSDINAVNEAYSNTENCPWGFIHEGFDYFMNNNTAVLAATPGKVYDIAFTDNGEGVDNRYYVAIWIRFNETVEIGYNFESWTTNESNWENQKSMITIQVDDWVEQGQEIGRFLQVGEGAHIHFDVIENNERQCHIRYYSPEAFIEIMELIHFYHSDWDYCYIE
ncbi:M23 family metallopeptidase [Promethearchaeum syntrophicum]|uniref:M23 family metallopeptidase n=1 Tax=Promethearchaeum syntrophicum TaxID=2594042 RepID=A0A5B9DCI1_9ARCH|nr:peptidoglycan DD-metalloendopeptidase family protein [Candidatus Prometheoarchaeum syntrophicum]QEE16864.1 Peptidase family M23 [Candidatus Prometheoarchaeum syntrophicum]